MDAVELLYKHYEDSVAQLKSVQKERDHFFVILGILLAFLYMLNISPNATLSTAQEIIKNQWGIETALSFQFFQSLIWFLLLYYTIRYCQRNIYSERLTAYIQHLEIEISSMSCVPFSREGNDYLAEYPKVLDLIYYFYTVFFPVCYMILVFCKIAEEYQCFMPIIDAFAAILCVAIVFLYFCFLHRAMVKKFFSKFHHEKK